MGNRYIYLDDLRDPKTDKDWNIVRNFNEFMTLIIAIDTITDDHVSYISFDHDLGDLTPTGYDCVKWLVEYDMDNDILDKEFKFNIHSANPVGAKNIEGLLSRYLRYKFVEFTK